MNLKDLRENLRLLTEEYFAAANVVYGETNMVKPKKALVTLKTGSVSRTLQPITEVIDGVPVGCYPSRTVLEVNLFTKGAQVPVETEQTIPMENTAVNDLVEFVNFVGSPYATDWCCEKDIAITPKGGVLDVTALLNSSKWEYRAMVEFDVDFVQASVGASGILAESSIVYPAIVPEWNGPSPSGGGTSELAAEETGYFEAVEIEQEIEQETEENET